MNSILLPDQSKIILKKLLGEGSFGKVYEINYKGTPSALKIVDKSKIKDQKILRTEIDIINKINEKFPNCPIQYILCYEEIQEDENQIYFISQLMEKDLFEFIHTQEYGNLDICKKIELIYELLLEMIDGLEVLHKIGIIHRDVKPENFLIGKDKKGEYVLKISDFGLSCFVEECSKTKVGTMMYISPRLLYGLFDQQEMDWLPYDDLYATALVIYECLIYDIFIDGDQIREQLNEPDNSYESFISFFKAKYDKNMEYLNELKIEIKKFCPSQVSQKIKNMIQFISLFLDPTVKDWKTLDTKKAKSILN
jgi:serine/threonine protein kinase